MNIQQQDYIRRMPKPAMTCDAIRSIWQILHIDPFLLLLLLLLTVSASLFAYSASQSQCLCYEASVHFFFMAYLGMLIVAHIKLSFFQRWSLLFYAGGVILLIAYYYLAIAPKAHSVG